MQQPSFTNGGRKRGRTRSHLETCSFPPVPASMVVPSQVESHTTPRDKFRARSRSPYIDRFGLQQPPPPSKLYGDDNIHRDTGVCAIYTAMTSTPTLMSLQRRVYLKEDQDLLPFHHEPETYIRSDRANHSTALVDAVTEATDMMNNIEHQSSIDHVDRRAQIHCLQGVSAFAHRSCLMRNSVMDRRSIEDRMEALLKEYSFDRMKRLTRKVNGVQAPEPYVPYPERDNDCHRMAGKSPRKDFD